MCTNRMTKIRLQLEFYRIQYLYIGAFDCHGRSSFSVRLKVVRKVKLEAIVVIVLVSKCVKDEN